MHKVIVLLGLHNVIHDEFCYILHVTYNFVRKKIKVKLIVSLFCSHRHFFGVELGRSMLYQMHEL